MWKLFGGFIIPYHFPIIPNIGNCKAAGAWGGKGGSALPPPH